MRKLCLAAVVALSFAAGAGATDVALRARDAVERAQAELAASRAAAERRAPYAAASCVAVQMPHGVLVRCASERGSL
jgi:hypothetical protein